MFPVLSRKTQRETRPRHLIEGAAKEIGGHIETSFGPRGMYKLTQEGEVLSSASEIVGSLEKTPFMDVIAKEISDKERENHDGTTTTAVFMEKLIDRASKLRDEGLSIPTILAGYSKTMVTMEEELGRIRRDFARDDLESVEKVVRDTVSKFGYEKIGDELKDAFLYLEGEDPDKDNIKIYLDEKARGSSVIKGLILDYDKKREDMPDSLDHGRVLLIHDLKPKKTTFDSKIEIRDTGSYLDLIGSEERELRQKVERIVDLGANLVLAKGEIDDRAAYLFAKRGIVAVEKVNDEDIKGVSRSTGALLTSSADVSSSTIGECGAVSASAGGCAGGICHI